MPEIVHISNRFQKGTGIPQSVNFWTTGWAIEAEHSPPSRTEFNAWSYTPFHKYAFVAY
jgi:hypothetical protein